MRNKHKKKVYLTSYEEYPIYEPAEGGYYYSGNEVVEYEYLSVKKARHKLKKYWRDLCKKNGALTNGRVYDDNNGFFYRMAYRNTNGIFYQARYIGDGSSIVIENKLGSETRGWEPYC